MHIVHFHLYRTKMNPEKLKQLQAKADQVRIGGKVSKIPVLVHKYY